MKKRKSSRSKIINLVILTLAGVFIFFLLPLALIREWYLNLPEDNFDLLFPALVLLATYLSIGLGKLKKSREKKIAAAMEELHFELLTADEQSLQIQLDLTMHNIKVLEILPKTQQARFECLNCHFKWYGKISKIFKRKACSRCHHSFQKAINNLLD